MPTLPFLIFSDLLPETRLFFLFGLSRGQSVLLKETTQCLQRVSFMQPFNLKSNSTTEPPRTDLAYATAAHQI